MKIINYLNATVRQTSLARKVLRVGWRSYQRSRMFSRYFYANALYKSALAANCHKIPIIDRSRADATTIEQYWSGHTIMPREIGFFLTRRESLNYIKSIDRMHPFYFQYCELHKPHPGKVILEYGCGPGNDLAGWVEHSQARKIIGMDVSLKALQQARHRLCLHPVKKGQVELIKISDSEPSIPLPDASVDYINCLGVLHHTSYPLEILKEFHRVLKKGGRAKLMVYHRHSLYVYLTIGYELQVLQGKYPGMPPDQAFYKVADSGAPRADCFSLEQFVALAQPAGFDVRPCGVAFNQAELESWRRHGGHTILEDTRLHPDSRAFMEQLHEDAEGYPRFDGDRYAGIDACFDLIKV